MIKYNDPWDSTPVPIQKSRLLWIGQHINDMRRAMSFMERTIADSFGHLPAAMDFGNKLTSNDIITINGKMNKGFTSLDYKLKKLEKDYYAIFETNDEADYIPSDHDEPRLEIPPCTDESLVEFDGIPRVRIPCLEQQNSFNILIFLNHKGEMTNTEISRVAHGWSNLTEKTVGSLIRLDLIERTHVRKQKGLRITPRGRKIAELAMQMNDVLNVSPVCP